MLYLLESLLAIRYLLAAIRTRQHRNHRKRTPAAGKWQAHGRPKRRFAELSVTSGLPARECLEPGASEAR
ncbi:MAG: hypothetical protein OXC19_14855 [Bryobacterales bacterium]|nr:hypothetical protein [Bryobacterales bacterium]